MVYIIYKTDDHHSYASRDTIAVCTNKKHILPICRKQAKKEGVKLDADQIFNLENIMQTQGYEGPGEFHFETVDINTLL